MWWSILAGDATIIAFFIARRALTPTGLTRACLLLVGAAGVTMTAQQDGHGLGIIAGAAIALLMLLGRRSLAARSTRCHRPTPISDERHPGQDARRPVRLATDDTRVGQRYDACRRAEGPVYASTGCHSLFSDLPKRPVPALREIHWLNYGCTRAWPFGQAVAGWTDSEEAVAE